MRCRAANSCTSTCCARTVSSSSSSRENSGTCRSSSTLHGMAEVLATQLSEEVRKEGLGSQVPLSWLSSPHPGPPASLLAGVEQPGPPASLLAGVEQQVGRGSAFALLLPLSFLFVIPEAGVPGQRAGWGGAAGVGRGSASALAFLVVIPAGDLRLP